VIAITMVVVIPLKVTPVFRGKVTPPIWTLEVLFRAYTVNGFFLKTG